jgi:hypothetical protein
VDGTVTVNGTLQNDAVVTKRGGGGVTSGAALRPPPSAVLRYAPPRPRHSPHSPTRRIFKLR